MDVHRSRFVPYPTSAISCLAFSRANDSGHHALPYLKLAIGRNDGSIEIWNPNHGLWVQEMTCPGDGRGVDGLGWTQDPDEVDADGSVVLGQQRLFSIASSPAVIEWDLETGLHKRRSTGNFSEVWCFAVQPRPSFQKNSTEEVQSAQEIVAGCGDGTIALLTTADNDLQFKRFLARVSGKKARCMCITYQSRDIVIAGFADSMIRVYDTRSGHQLRTMSFGVGVPGTPKNILVWQVKCLPNGDIVSADSNGEVRIWDRKTYSLVQRIKGHSADCVDIVTSTDGHTIFSGSIDGRIAVYRQSQAAGAKRHWAKVSGRSIHHGGVKAMAAFDSKSMSVVVLGGSGVAPMVLPLREYGKAYPRSLPNLPHHSPVTSAREARLLVSWWHRQICIWRMSKSTTSRDQPSSVPPKKMVASISLDTKQNLRSVTITEDGSMLAASTNDEIKLFHLRKDSKFERLAIRKLQLPSDFAALGARLLRFSPDGHWLVAVSPSNEVHLARVIAASTSNVTPEVLPRTVELDRLRRKISHQSAYRLYDRSITHVAFAQNSCMLAVGDRCGFIDAWLLDGHEDTSAPAVGRISEKTKDESDSDSDSSESSSEDDDDDDENVTFFGQHWQANPTKQLLPRLDSFPLVFTFRPSPPSDVTDTSPPYHLWVMTAKHDIYEFDMLRGRSTEWAHQNPSSVLPAELTTIKDRAMGAVWDVTAQRQRLWLYGASWLFMLNMAEGLRDASQEAGVKNDRRRRKRGDDGLDRYDAVVKKARINTGAGDRVAIDERVGLEPLAVQNGAEHPTENMRIEEAEDDIATTDDRSVAKTNGHAAEADQITHPNASTLDPVIGEDELAKSSTRRWWRSFEYRPILGMVPLGGDHTSSASAKDVDNVPLEVVIVERPVWEATSSSDN